MTGNQQLGAATIAGGPSHDGCPPDIRQVLRSVTSGARQRARLAGKDADPSLMTVALDLYLAQGGRCALSGLRFDLRQVGSGKARRPFAPSLDRIDSTGGYTRDNVRLVCQAVNFALNAYGEDVFSEIAKATASFEPTIVAPSEAERRRKTAYIQHVVDEAPRILEVPLPIDEANAYGWGFRRLTEAGVIEPASGSALYRLRTE